MVELSCEGDIRYTQTFHKSFGGDTLNVAVAASRLGSEVTYVTRIANDPFGFALQEILIKEGIQSANPRPLKGQTGLYFVSLDHNAQREFYYYRKDSAATHLGPEDITPALIKSAKIVYASGISLAISKSCHDAVHKAFQLARENDVMTAFDPNYREAMWSGEEQALDALNEILPLTTSCLINTLLRKGKYGYDM